MENSAIEWTHHTFNPWIGCSKVSAGCKNCYAEFDMDNRRKRVVWGANGTRSVTSYTYWREALKWNRDAEIAGERRRVFCASLADVFEDWLGNIIDSKKQILWWEKRWVENKFSGDSDCDVDGIPKISFYNEEYLSKHNENLDYWQHLTMDIIRNYLFLLIEMTPHLDWLLLTKRPENIMRMVPDYWQRKFPDNVWIGTSVEDNEMAMQRIPIMATIPAKVKFLSMEPQLENIDLVNAHVRNLSDDEHEADPGKRLIDIVDWIINGGESGHKKRPYDVEWGRSLRDQCAGAGVPFFFKQVDKVMPIPEDLLIKQLPAA